MTILKKREGFQQAFSGLDIDRVARDGVRDRARLLSDSAIIRNRLKVDAAIENARRLQTLRPSHGSFCGWLAAHHPLSKQDRVKLFKQTFVFMGGEIVGESLMSVGYLPDAHREDCPIMGRTRKLEAPCRTKKLQQSYSYIKLLRRNKRQKEKGKPLMRLAEFLIRYWP